MTAVADEEHFRKLERLYHGAPINHFYQPTLMCSTIALTPQVGYG